MPVALHEGDCLDVLKSLPDKSVDSVVTDPPYGISFMGKKWDYDIPSVDLWQEVLRVLKPGGHLLSFCGTRTYHRMVVAIEDAGFEIRDQIGWLYGSGFPKSLDVSKAIDKAAGAEREILGYEDTRSTFDGRNRRSSAINTNWRAAEGRSDIRDLSKKEISKPETEFADKWQGWGTALKPSHENIVLARRPLIGTVAENVLTYGTGAMNIDACRVGTEVRTYDLKGGENLNKIVRDGGNDADDARSLGAYGIGAKQVSIGTATVAGRWPANIIHDGSDEVLGIFPDRKTTYISPSHANNRSGEFLGELDHPGVQGFNDSGSAARFFYCAKASKSERAGSTHPTVKPIALMRYLCRLVTPTGGTVLDPFAGSGTTGQAAVEEGFNAVLIEREAEYCDGIRNRLVMHLDEESLLQWK